MAIGGIWFDGMWDKPMRTGGCHNLRADHRLQPAALIVRTITRHRYRARMCRRSSRIFRAPTAGFNTRRSAVCRSRRRHDERFVGLQSHRSSLQVDARADSYSCGPPCGRNLLLNIGPRPDGTIPPEAEDGCARWDVAGGEWRRDLWHACRPIPPRSWGVTTQRGDTVFLHVLDWSDRRSRCVPRAGRWKARMCPVGRRWR